LLSVEETLLKLSIISGFKEIKATGRKCFENAMKNVLIPCINGHHHPSGGDFKKR